MYQLAILRISKAVLEVIGPAQIIKFLLREIQLATEGRKSFKIGVLGRDLYYAHH